MKRSFLAGIALSLLLMLAAVPAVLAADGVTPDPSVDPSPVASEPAEATPTPDPSGELVVDPPAATPTPDPTSVDEIGPVSDVKGIQGRADATPPATDTVITTSSSNPGSGLQVLLLLAVAGSILALAVGRLPVARRR